MLFGMRRGLVRFLGHLGLRARCREIPTPSKVRYLYEVELVPFEVMLERKLLARGDEPEPDGLDTPGQPILPHGGGSGSQGENQGEVSSMTLLDRYDEWADERASQSMLEDQGEADADDWARLDDQGCDLAREFASAYEGLLKAASNVIASWDQGDLAAAVRDLKQVAMLDTASSASRQHYIDAGRYMQEAGS